MHSILVIEDNKSLRENTAEILILAGYQVHIAENGKSGIEIALTENPDIIICDITMPDLDGYGVLHVLNINKKTIPFIFLTARSERSDQRKGMDLSADDYITKPFDEIELLSAIETRLRKKETLTEHYQHNWQGLKSLPTEFLNGGLVEHLKKSYDTINYRKKQVLYQENKRPKYVYYVISGKVKAVKTNDEGKEYIESLFTIGDFIGYLPVIEDRNYNDNSQVMEDAELLMIPRVEFLNMLHESPVISRQFIGLLSSDIRTQQERLLNLAYSSLRRRVAMGLLEIDAKFNQNEMKGRIDISRDDIAHYVGTATESLIRTLSEFKREKLISIIDGRISLLQPEKLQDLL